MQVCEGGAAVAEAQRRARVFGVKLSIGGEDGLSVQNGQIWLQLRGTAGDTQAAKVLYIPRCSVSVYLSETTKTTCVYKVLRCGRTSLHCNATSNCVAVKRHVQ